MTKPTVSPNFTVDDIHKIREWNYERRKDMTFDEYCKDVATGANRILRQIQEIKRNGTRI
ncbi:MAG: hypothetical protein Ta2A_03270 [Treponemataceae bacterium]|nr:MAG: hypothetical protein Ta2A_03270 [Treponemataceae bacterium]